MVKMQTEQALELERQDLMALAFVCKHSIAVREVVEFLIVPDSL